MSSIENGTGSVNGSGPGFGITEFGSTSTKERSKISVEKRNDIVKPNVSPNKPGNQNSNSEPAAATAQPTSLSITKTTTKVISTSTKTDQTKRDTNEPKANFIQVSMNDEVMPCCHFQLTGLTLLKILSK